LIRCTINRPDRLAEAGKANIKTLRLQMVRSVFMQI
jgi:hypothetical protein